jgi:hypothetical protein
MTGTETGAETGTLACRRVRNDSKVFGIMVLPEHKGNGRHLEHKAASHHTNSLQTPYQKGPDSGISGQVPRKLPALAPAG